MSLSNDQLMESANRCDNYNMQIWHVGIINSNDYKLNFQIFFWSIRIQFMSELGKSDMYLNNIANTINI